LEYLVYNYSLTAADYPNPVKPKLHVEGDLNITDGLYVDGSVVGIASHSNSGAIRRFGVYGGAGNNSPGYNIITAGSLRAHASDAGAAIYGNVNGWPGVIPGRYAGYFNGNAHIQGNLTYTGTSTQSSDKRQKKI